MNPLRRRIRVTTAAGVLLMAVAAPAPVSAATASAAPGSTTAVPGSRPLTGASSGKRITLITGDVVTYDAHADKGEDVKVTAARRADGRPVGFFQRRQGDALYVIPSDALGLIGTGRLDKSLFDVAYLARSGYADDASARIPVIAQYGGTVRDAKALSREADALPANTSSRPLTAIHGAAFGVTKSAVRTFWDTVAPAAGDAQPKALAGGLGKLWLDRKVTVTLDKSVPQIGAPEAWKKGLDGKGVKVAVVDTGIDLHHPDFAGRIGDTANFSTESSVQDGHGHGTHVASIIAGSGAASGGRYKGVAPGATLLAAKVLDNRGSGADSQVIEGMQWAAEHGAKVISMSLGSQPTDGTDPASQAVNDLTRQYGALFVIAAGNSGPQAGTVDSPGTADAALTVAAVDKQDKLADFSSRGPRAGDFGLKPDIAAPGVDIVAARAAGTNLGTAVDANYTTLSGTSMATPHVAGAAAILAQQHPDKSPAWLKSVLTGTAKDDGYGTFEQGAGRVDVAQAVTGQVHADGDLNFGLLSYPQSGPVTKTITYVNDGDQPVTLALALTLKAHAGGTPDKGMLSADHDTVTVPAGGSTPVKVTLDPSKGPATWYEGAVRATGSGVRVTTALGAYEEARKVKLSGHVIPPDGATDVTYSGWAFMRVDDRDDLDYGVSMGAGQDAAADVYPGAFTLTTYATWRDADHRINSALVTAPEVDADHDTAVTLDLRKARKVSVRTPRPTEGYAAQFGLRRVPATGTGYLTLTGDMPYGSLNMWMLPTTKVTQGTFLAFSQHLLGAPPVTMRGRWRGAPALHPEYQPYWKDQSGAVPMLNGRLRLPVVYGGHGNAADLQGVDVRGKLVLLSLDDICTTTCTANALDRVKNAAQGGAAGVLGFGGTARSFFDPARSWPLYPIPTMSLTAEEGRALLTAVRAGTADIDVTGVPNTPYVYSLKFYENGRIPDSLRYSVGAKDLVETAGRFHLDRAGRVDETWYATHRGEPGSPSDLSLDAPAPGSRTEYVGPVSPDVLWQRDVAFTYDDPGGDYNHRNGRQYTYVDAYPRPGHRTADWGAQPIVPGDDPPTASLNANFPGSRQCFPCRTGDLLVTALPVVGAGSASSGKSAFSWSANGVSQYGGKDEQHLYRADGTEVPLVEQKAILGIFAFPVPTFTLPEGEAAYRLTDKYHTPNPLQRYATDVETAWTFRSARPKEGMTSLQDGLCVGWLVTQAIKPCAPMRTLNLRYDLGLDLDNRLPRGTHRIRIGGYHGSFGDSSARLTRLKLWVTFDDGAHWTQVATRAEGTGFTAAITDPAAAAGRDAVGLRVQATDTEGNTIDQTTHRAYGLK
ncbi:S8 family serine peptidase [Actinoallomurus sp. CA-150999]|uniref:S8 family serine peptidase n=1 Tax=Actinoallomurus sp. CA-150999 TaxID=3239887 RepID=UPI003D8CFCA9